jgi:hypothetical protein
MRNLNEPHRESREPEVVPFERRSPSPKETIGSLLPARQVQELRERWTAIQSRFVDEPRKAVEEADQLIASAIKQIEEVFTAERNDLGEQWHGPEEPTTEDLRQCLQHYRDVFDRLLSR